MVVIVHYVVFIYCSWNSTSFNENNESSYIEKDTGSEFIGYKPFFFFSQFIMLKNNLMLEGKMWVNSD